MERATRNGSGDTCKRNMNAMSSTQRKAEVRFPLMFNMCFVEQNALRRMKVTGSRYDRRLSRYLQEKHECDVIDTAQSGSSISTNVQHVFCRAERAASNESKWKERRETEVEIPARET